MSTNYFSKPKLASSDFWKKPRPFWLGFVILVVLTGIVLFIVNSASKISFPEQIKINIKPKVSLLNVAPLAQGKQSYDIVTASSKSFKIIQVDVDLLDVKKGETQTVIVRVEDTENNPITKENKVEAIVYQDNTSTPFSFDFKKAEGAATPTITTWQGSWVSEDTNDFKYTMTVTAKSADSEHTIDLSFR